MDKQHTPGPWRADGAEVWATKPIRFNLTTAGTPMIATACKHQDAEGGFPFEANARLIAAAPDLLEALVALTEDIADRFDMESPSTNPGIKHCIEQARAALARVKGDV